MGGRSKLLVLPDTHRDGRSCCSWGDFIESFGYYWRKNFGFDPAGAQLRIAHKDWLLGLTGWEAAEMQRQKAAKTLKFEEPDAPQHMKDLLR